MLGVLQQFTLTQKKLQETCFLTVCAVVTDFSSYAFANCLKCIFSVTISHRKAAKCSLIAHSCILSLQFDLHCFVLATVGCDSIGLALMDWNGKSGWHGSG